ncbi:MAG: exo-alpha-sialidase [Chloroflexota bacterium]
MMVSISPARIVFFAMLLFVAVPAYLLFPIAGAPPAAAAPLFQEGATPDPCGPPVLRPAGGEINVRSGPGLNYPAIGSLDRDETARVIGRAAYVEFWQVELADGTSGWAGDGVVVVDGYIEDLPIVEPPELDGATATPGLETWNPAPRIECLATHTPTPDPVTPTPTPTLDAEASATLAANPWGQPLNISQSGKATNVQSAVDASGVTHVVWQEPGIGNFFYARGNSEGWTEAIPVELPFGTRRYYPDLGPTDPTPLFTPTLVADAGGRIHAFWLDDLQNIRYSSVAAGEFGDFGSWNERQTLSTNALALSATADDSGRLHMVSIRTLPSEDAPAGVYYRQLGEEPEWSEPIMLYNSAYLRSLTSDNVNLHMDAGSSNRLFVVWDNAPLEKIFLSRSTDGGQSWESATEIDRREEEDAAGATGPRQIKVGTGGENVVLQWQAGHGGKACAQYYASSSDGGDNWSAPRELEEFPDCSPENRLFSSGNGLVFLMTRFDRDVYLLAWNGERWSSPQFQETLTSFVNADTFQTVELDCLQPYVAQDSEIVMVGCSTGEVQDAWVATRPLGSPESWFPPPSAWDSPTTVATSNSEPLDLTLVGDAEGRLHTIWRHSDETAIYYSRWSGSWSQAVPVLNSPESNPVQPHMVVTQDQHLLVVWGDSRTGRIYFSGAETGQAITAANWSEPQALASPDAIATAPYIVAAPDGTVYVVYAIPVNEGRGIYLVQSDDNGQTWSEPSRVFDGATLAQAASINPRLAFAGDGQLHMLWQLYSLPPETAPLALYYTGSTDGGQTWDEPELVVEAPVIWSHIERANSGVLYRLWQERGATHTTLQFQTSVDEGNSWDFPAILPDLSGDHAALSVVMDTSGRLHLLQLSRSNILQHWIGEGDEWRSEEPLALEIGPTDSSLLSATGSEEDSLHIVYSTLRPATEESLPTNVILAANRSLEPGAQPAAPLPTPTPTPTPSPAASPSPTPSPTPTRVFPTEFQSGGGSLIPFADSNNPLLSGLATALPALLIILVAVAVGIVLRTIRTPRTRN